MRRLVYAALLLPLLVVPSSSQERKKKREPDPLMVAKLKESQTLLEGLTLNDLAKVRKSAEKLLEISKTAQMRKALNTARYDLHANNFQRSAETVIEKAKDKNIDGAALAYVDMTITCVRCHQYTREQGLGRLAPAGAGDGIGE
jgi:GH24 family phage-related lysozyme (muramidase)